MSDKKYNNSFFDGFKPQDAAKVVILVPLIALSVVVSVSNIYSYLLATFEPVFTASPIKAVLLATLAGTGSLAIEQATTVIKREHNKLRYNRVIVALFIMSFLAWMVVFPMVFNGIGSGEETEGVSDSVSTAYMSIHILTEILATSCLIMSLGATLKKYYPAEQYRNPVYSAELKKRNAFKSKEAELEKVHLSKLAAAAQLKAAKQAFIKEQEQAFALDVMRHDTLFKD